MVRMVRMVRMGSIVSRRSTQREQKYCRGRGQEELSSCASARAPVFASASAAGLALWAAGGEYAAIHRAHRGAPAFCRRPLARALHLPQSQERTLHSAPRRGRAGRRFVESVCPRRALARAGPTSEDGMPCHHRGPSTRATASPEVSSILVMAVSQKAARSSRCSRAGAPRFSTSINQLAAMGPTAGSLHMDTGGGGPRRSLLTQTTTPNRCRVGCHRAAG
jgi:hypothetical protein